MEIQINFNPGTGGSETFQGILSIITDSETNPVFTANLTGKRLAGALAPGSLIYAINAGGGEYTATDGTVYEADRLFSGGRSFSVNSANNPVAGTTDDILFNTERTGNFNYRLPVENGSYEVTLRFAELFWQRSGARSFSVNAEGTEVITAVDLFSLVGHDVAYDMTYTVNVTDSVLDLDFITITDNATLSAIVIRTLPTPVELVATATEKAGTDFVIHFTAPPGLTNFSLLSSHTLTDFTPNPDIPVTFNEVSEGLYQATINSADLGECHFFVIQYTP